MFRRFNAIIRECRPSLKSLSLKPVAIKQITFVEFLDVVNSVDIIIVDASSIVGLYSLMMTLLG
jgi:hypothetical protein